MPLFHLEHSEATIFNRTPLVISGWEKSLNDHLRSSMRRTYTDQQEGRIVAKTYDDNLRFPKFKKLIEEARLMVQQGKKGDAAYHVLEHMEIESNEDNSVPFSHIPDRQLGEMIGVSHGTVSKERGKLKAERFGIEKVIEKVDTSKVKVIGRGSESVYLYYFSTYRQYSELFLREPHWPCNIGRTKGDLKDRVSEQIGKQLPEKPKIALIIRTGDCETLEKKIHDELKRRGCWLDPKSGADVVGVEWFLTNPSEVEGIVKSVHSTENSNE